MMTKRLQVLFDDDELADFQRLAKRRRQTTAAWVRDTLRAARRAEDSQNPEVKLRAIREAVAYAFPTGEIEAINADIERGYIERGFGEGGYSERQERLVRPDRLRRSQPGS